MGVTSTKNNFEKVYYDYFKLIYLYIYKRIGNTHDAEEVASEVFLAAWKNFELYNIELSLKSWLFGIARHKLNDFLRKKYQLQSTFQTLDSEELKLDPSQFANFNSNFNSISSPEANTSSEPSAFKTILSELVAQLTVEEQRFIELRFEQNFKIHEVAAELGITENNTKVRQNRLIKKLKMLWKIKSS